MNRLLRIILALTLAVVMVAGLGIAAGCDNADGNGDTTDNGNTSVDGDTNVNGDANGDGDTNGNGNTDGELVIPDLTSGLGTVIDCDENTTGNFVQGDPAPDFRFQDAAGQTFSLSDFQGRMVMLNFWKTTCGWCVFELPYLQQIYEEWPEEELAIIAVDVGESAETVSTYLAENGFSLPVVVDTERNTSGPYLINSIPRTFFIDKYGNIQGIMPGAFTSTEDISEILDKLKALQGD